MSERIWHTTDLRMSESRERSSCGKQATLKQEKCKRTCACVCIFDIAIRSREDPMTEWLRPILLDLGSAIGNDDLIRRSIFRLDAAR